MRTASALLTGLLLGLPTLAAAQELGDDGWISAVEVDEQRRARSPFAGSRLAVELLEPVGSTRGQLIARGIFSDGDAVFSSNTAWTMEGRIHAALSEQFGITGVLPIGVVSPSSGSTKALFGNIGIGFAGGGAFDLVDPIENPTPIRLRLGGAVEGFFPTASSGSATTELYALLLASMRGYEPFLYVPKLFVGRVRAQVGLSIGDLTTQLELSLVPGAVLEEDAVFLIGAVGRASYEVDEVFEPFLEMGGTTQVAGYGQIKPPFMITPGVRLNISRHFRPALFASFNFVAAKAIMFGVDLAATMPSEHLRRRAVADDPSDFLPGL